MLPSKKQKTQIHNGGGPSTDGSDSSSAFQFFKLGQGIVSIPKLLSPSECEQYIRNADNQIFEASKVGDPSTRKNKVAFSIRNSAQIKFEDELLSERVFSKCEKAIKELVGWNDQAKFNPVKIDSNWKLYRYKKGQYFDSHVDSGRKVGELSSFITVLIYLNGDLEGGETVFDNESVSIHPEEGNCVMFLHQLKHSANEITSDKEKLVIKSAVLFEKNNNYEQIMKEKYGDHDHGSGNHSEEPLNGPVIVEVGGKQFEMESESISKFPESMLCTLIRTPMMSDVTTNEKGIHIFKFPSQNPTLFKKFILPIFNGVKQLDIPIDSDPTQQLEMDSEFKFWGLLSPFDGDSISKETQYSNKKEPWKSPELALISEALVSTLDKRRQDIEGKIAILKSINGVKSKLQQHNPKRKNASIEDRLNNKYEVIPFTNLYDQNFFLMNTDKDIYETCLALFGSECVSLGDLKFVLESNGHCDSTSSTKCDSSADMDGKSIYSFEVSSLIEELEDKGVKDIEGELDKCGIIFPTEAILKYGKKENTWTGEYNDEYYPQYSLFKLSAIFINVEMLQNKQ